MKDIILIIIIVWSAVSFTFLIKNLLDFYYKFYKPKSVNKIELSEEALFYLLKDAYKNGYSSHEIVEAGLESYDPDTYAKWVIKHLK